MFYTSRSAIDQFQRCPRSRYLQYLYPVDDTNIGVVPATRSVPLTTGTCVHAGIEQLLKRHILGADVAGDPTEVEAAIVVAQKAYHELVAGTTFEGMGEPEHRFTLNEQMALTEALVRAWVLVEYPQLTARYNVLSAEKELTPVELAPGILLQVRADAILSDKEDNSKYVYSLKTLKQWGDREAKAYPDDLQGITEMYGLENQPNAPVRCMGVRFCILVKGRRERAEWDNPNSPMIQASPLIRGYKFIGEDRVRYAHSFWFPNAQNKSGKGRLGQGWERFNVWEDNKVGLKRWLLTLQAQRIQPECGDILRGQVVTPPEVFRDQREMLSTLLQISTQEQMVAEAIRRVNAAKDGDKQVLIDKYFPQYRHACYYPTDCPMVPICKDRTIADNILESGLYQIRTPHHEPEKEYLEV